VADPRRGRVAGRAVQKGLTPNDWRSIFDLWVANRPGPETTIMDQLQNWKARRAGGRITITHATGKVVGVDCIQPENARNPPRAVIVATDKDGRKYELIA
jgi:hypothetical protein